MVELRELGAGEAYAVLGIDASARPSEIDDAFFARLASIREERRERASIDESDARRSEVMRAYARVRVPRCETKVGWTGGESPALQLRARLLGWRRGPAHDRSKWSKAARDRVAEDSFLSRLSTSEREILSKGSVDPDAVWYGGRAHAPLDYSFPRVPDAILAEFGGAPPDAFDISDALRAGDIVISGSTGGASELGSSASSLLRGIDPETIAKWSKMPLMPMRESEPTAAEQGPKASERSDWKVCELHGAIDFYAPEPRAEAAPGASAEPAVGAIAEDGTPRQRFIGAFGSVILHEHEIRWRSGETYATSRIDYVQLVCWKHRSAAPFVGLSYLAMYTGIFADESALTAFGFLGIFAYGLAAFLLPNATYSTRVRTRAGHIFWIGAPTDSLVEAYERTRALAHAVDASSGGKHPWRGRAADEVHSARWRSLRIYALSTAFILALLAAWAFERLV